MSDVLALFGFLGYWWAHYSEVLQSKLNGLREGDAGKVVRVLILKAWGFVVMGLIPAWVLSAQFGWTTKSLGVTWPTKPPRGMGSVGGIDSVHHVLVRGRGEGRGQELSPNARHVLVAVHDGLERFGLDVVPLGL